MVGLSLLCAVLNLCSLENCVLIPLLPVQLSKIYAVICLYNGIKFVHRSIDRYINLASFSPLRKVSYAHSVSLRRLKHLAFVTCVIKGRVQDNAGDDL